jgi:hypothetical protein
VLERARGLVKKLPSNLLQLAEILIQSGEPAPARLLVAQCLRKRPGDERALALQQRLG